MNTISPQVALALIAAFSALAVSVVTGIFQFVNVKAQQKAQSSRDQAQKLQEISLKAYSERLAAIREASKCIQGLQDEILTLVKAAPKSLLSRGQRERINAARDKLIDCYLEYHSYLKEEDRRSLGLAKEKAIEIVSSLELEKAWSSTYLSLNKDIAQDLAMTIQALSSYQQKLLASALAPVGQDVTGEY